MATLSDYAYSVDMPSKARFSPLRHLSQRFRKCAFSVVLGLGAFAATQATAGQSEELRWGTIHWRDGIAVGTSRTGKTVDVGLDPELTHDVRHLLARAKPLAGAAVLVDPRSGQVLAASEIGKSSGSLLFDPVAPAASVFKVVTTTALYERTSVTPTTRVCTQGGLRRIERSHLRPAHGAGSVCSPFAHALGVSRNAAYAQLATTELMRSDLVEVADALSFNSSLALDVRGRLGSLEVPYNDLEFAQTAAGFRGSRLSVFGGAQLAMLVANEGILRPMHFIADSKDGTSAGRRIFGTRTARRIRKAMEVTIHSGTARDSFVKPNGRGSLGPIQVAGKTGTLKPEPGGPTASWFIGFAPSENPTVVISVLLQNPERWHQKGHQLARDILETYFARHGVKGLQVIQ